MPVFLNAFPLKLPSAELNALRIPFSKDQLIDLRARFHSTHAFRRQNDNIIIFSSDGTYPVSGETETIWLKENFGIFCALVKDGLSRHLTKMRRYPIGFHPIELVSLRPEDDLLSSIVGKTYPLKIAIKYSIDTRIIRDKPYLVIDCSTRRVVKESCRYFLKDGFNLIGRYVVVEQDDGFRKLLGLVSSVTKQTLQITQLDGQTTQAEADEVYLEASRTNFDDYILHTHGAQKDAIIERIRNKVSTFNGGESKKLRIEKLKKYIQKEGITLIDGTRIEIGDSPDIQQSCAQIQKPVFIFNDNGEANWAERGLTLYGPYTKRTFDRNNPSICVICTQQDQGRVEQFVRKFLKGIPTSKYFRTGLEGKFSIGTSRHKVFVTSGDNAQAYINAIESAIKSKADEGGRWDLALVQVRQSFKKLKVDENPYYIGKNRFFLQHVPVQDFTIELTRQNDQSLGFSLNNMALACYAKMGGVPWLLKSSPTLSHELVIGIGSANIGQGRGAKSRRIMGITTVFSGDGSYIVSNTSKAVTPDAYCNALTDVLGETIEKVKTRMNWQQDDTIRLVFHAQVKRFNNDEIKAVRSVINKYREYQIEYAFVKVSENHGLHMFDTETASAPKGRLAPLRGKRVKLSGHEMLVYLIGQKELRQKTDGHPRGLILDVHKDSTFKDLTYLSTQLFNFASHSWRSYFPNPMPVTISYSDLIAQNLGWLNELGGWNDSVMIGKIGQSQWFL